ncbi:MAG: hypothetical protein N2508_04705, partial [Anaerolineae bacterium]|nr:hypothetical protein [Anaerolineae bacterium]
TLTCTAARLPRLRHLAFLLPLSVLIFSAWATSRDYFVRWARWPSLTAVMDVGKWRAAETILNSPASETLLVTIPDGLEPAISYALSTNRAARAFDGAHCLVYPSRLTLPVHYVVVLGYEHRSLERLRTIFPPGYRQVDPLFGDGAPYFVHFFVPAGTEANIPGELHTPIMYRPVLLHGVYLHETTVRAGQALTVTLTWGILEPTPNDYTVFVHLLEESSEAAASPLKAQHDSPPCNGTEPTWRWRPGEYILDEHVLQLPAELSAGAYLIGVGLYDSRTLERVPLTTPDVFTRWGEAIVGYITVVAR